jgi:hypothetical protein
MEGSCAPKLTSRINSIYMPVQSTTESRCAMERITCSPVARLVVAVVVSSMTAFGTSFSLQSSRIQFDLYDIIPLNKRVKKSEIFDERPKQFVLLQRRFRWKHDHGHKGAGLLLGP